MAATNGNPDTYFVARVRRMLRDQVVRQPDKFPTDAVTGQLLAGSKPFRLTQPPIWTGSAPLLTAPGGVYAVAFDPGLSGAPGAPVLADGGAGGTLGGGNYKVFWALGPAGAPTSEPSPVSAQLTIVANHLITVTNLPNPIPAGGLTLYFTNDSQSTGFCLFIAAGAVGPYNISAPGTTLLPAFVVSDTGELYFGFAPAVGTLAVTYQHSRFSDQQILDALNEGLNLLWPELWNPSTNTTQVAISPTQFEYTLQALFQDQRAIILDVEYAPPSGFIRYYRTSLWRQLEDIVNPTLIFSELPPISSIIRITYCQTFGTLGSVMTQAQHLPCYYAVARLLADQEVARSRADDMLAQSPGENAAPPGAALSAAAFWLERFNEQVSKMSLDAPARRMIADRAVESLGLSDFWVHAA